MSHKRNRSDARAAITEGQREHDEFRATQEEDEAELNRLISEAAEQTLRYEMEEQEARDIDALKTLRDTCVHRGMCPHALTVQNVIRILDPFVAYLMHDDARRILNRFRDWINDDSVEPELGKLPDELRFVDIYA